MVVEIWYIFGFFAKKIVFVFAKKAYFDVPHAKGVLGRTSVEPNTPGPSWSFSEIFRPARFFKLRKREVSDKNKNFADFADFAYFRLINHIKPAKHRPQAHFYRLS